LKIFSNYIIGLLILNILILSAGYLVILITGINILPGEIVILSCAFTAIVYITLFIFMMGQKKSPGSQTIYSMVSVSLKFILEMVLALIWFVVAKKTAFSSVILFFILYLTFTLFSILHIINTLKNKSLQKQV